MHNENVHAQLFYLQISVVLFRLRLVVEHVVPSVKDGELLFPPCIRPKKYRPRSIVHSQLLQAPSISEIRVPYIGYYCSTWRNCCVQIIVQYNKIKNARQGMVLGLLVVEFMLIGVKLGLWVLSGCSANFTQPKIVVVFEHPGTSRNGVSGCINQSQSAVRC